MKGPSERIWSLVTNLLVTSSGSPPRKFTESWSDSAQAVMIRIRLNRSASPFRFNSARSSLTINMNFCILLKLKVLNNKDIRAAGIRTFELTIFSLFSVSSMNQLNLTQAQITLSQSQARRIILHAAGLSRPAQFGKGREAVYKLIEHLGYIQVDTNYTVERAHHHAIFSRVPDYKPEWLEELQADGRIFEFFTADSGFQPMHEFRFSLPVKQSFAAHRKPLTPAETNLTVKVLDRVAREGPLMVKDFENDRQEASSGWWGWRPSKVALERLFLDGRLMTTRTRDFQKLYDLPKNLLPDDTDTTVPPSEEFARHSILRVLRSLGIAYVKEMTWRARFVKGHCIREEIGRLVEEGKVCPVKIEGLK